MESILEKIAIVLVIGMLCACSKGKQMNNDGNDVDIKNETLVLKDDRYRKVVCFSISGALSPQGDKHSFHFYFKDIDFLNSKTTSAGALGRSNTSIVDVTLQSENFRNEMMSRMAALGAESLHETDAYYVYVPKKLDAMPSMTILDKTSEVSIRYLADKHANRDDKTALENSVDVANYVMNSIVDCDKE